MKVKYPDYTRCITSLACSIRKEFGGGAGEGETLEVCDRLLEKSYQNVVVLLLDGMGTCIVEKNLDPQGFFASHLIDSYSSVFPSTTVAATTSVLSGKNPCGHGWLGWDYYFKQIDKNVTVFLNTESGTDKPAADFPVAYTYCPYQSLVEIINGLGNHAYYASPFADPYPSDFEGVCERIASLCMQKGKKYIYAYWSEPDGTMHRKGCYAKETKEVLARLETQVEELCGKLEDTLLIVTADHGHMDSRGAAIVEYPKIMECLVRLPSIEPRALNLFVKEGMEQQFETVFRKAFGDEFLLLTREEVKRSRLFGTGEEHPCFSDMLGDYLAVAVSDLSIYNTVEERDHFVGVHAGLTEDEMVIPFIAIEKKKKGAGGVGTFSQGEGSDARE